MVPAAIGAKVPVPSTVPMAGSDDDHAPPGVDDDNTVLMPVQVDVPPVIADGLG